MNPSNSDEFIYYKPASLSGEPLLIKYNLLDSQKTVLFEGNLFFPPKWGKEGWILLNYNDHIYKLKDDGDSLTQVTFSGNDYSPEWNLWGDKFITQHVDNGHSYSIIYDKEGKIIDSLASSAVGSCWQQDSIVIFPLSLGYGIGAINIIRDSSYEVFSFNQTEIGNVFSCFWSDTKEEIYFSSTEGIFSYNIGTGSITCLKTNCPNDFYYSLSSFGGDIMLLCKEHLKSVGNGIIVINCSIIQINIDGSNEEKVILN